MDLLDLWCGCLSWRKLATHVRWLPRDAALYQSMRLARPAKVPTTAPTLVVDDPLAAMKHGYMEDLLLSVLNHIEARDYAETPKDDRPATFTPTLPAGYKLAEGVDHDAMIAAYFAGIRPPTD